VFNKIPKNKQRKKITILKMIKLRKNLRKRRKYKRKRLYRNKRRKKRLKIQKKWFKKDTKQIINQNNKNKLK
jgi:hypothetical protein